MPFLIPTSAIVALILFLVTSCADVQAQPVTICPKDYCNPALNYMCNRDNVPTYDNYEPAGTCLFSVTSTPTVTLLFRVVREVATGKLCTCSTVPLVNKQKKCINSLKACKNTKACSHKYTQQSRVYVLPGERYTWTTTCKSAGKDALVLKLELESTNANFDFCYCPKGKDTETPVPWQIPVHKAPFTISDTTNKCPSTPCEPSLAFNCRNKVKNDLYASYTGACKAYGSTYNVLTYVNKPGKPQCVCSRDNTFNGVPPVPITTCPTITCKGPASSIKERYGCCDQHLFMGNKYCTTPLPVTFSLHSLCNANGKRHKVLKVLALPEKPPGSFSFNYCTCP